MITFKFITTDDKTRTIRTERNYDALIQVLEEKMNRKPWYEKEFKIIEVNDKENKVRFTLYDYDDYSNVNIIINALEYFKLSELTFDDFINIQKQSGTFIAYDDISIYDSVDELLKEELEYHTIDLEGRLNTDDGAFNYIKIFNIEYLKDLVLNTNNVFLSEDKRIVIISRYK